MFSVSFFVTSVALGIALAIDAFSVSLANGLCYPNMKKKFIIIIPSVFSLLQIVMPLTGWICVRTIVDIFGQLQRLIPFIAMVVLLFLGVKMLIDAFQKEDITCPTDELNFTRVFFQGIATSLDALSVGFTISNYNLVVALVAASIIGVITFFLCLVGVHCGKIVGLKYAKPASIFGGGVLIVIGIKIFIESLF